MQVFSPEDAALPETTAGMVRCWVSDTKLGEYVEAGYSHVHVKAAGEDGLTSIWRQSGIGDEGRRVHLLETTEENRNRILAQWDARANEVDAAIKPARDVSWYYVNHSYCKGRSRDVPSSWWINFSRRGVSLWLERSSRQRWVALFLGWWPPKIEYDFEMEDEVFKLMRQGDEQLMREFKETYGTEISNTSDED